MSKFHTKTNVNRVAKMVETVGHLNKSALSNKANIDEIDTIFGPLIAALQDMGVRIEYVAGDKAEPAPQETAQVTHSAPVTPGVSTPMWLTVREMAERAPLRDLASAMAVYTTRMDDVLHEIGLTDPSLVTTPGQSVGGDEVRHEQEKPTIVLPEDEDLEEDLDGDMWE